MTLFQGPSCHQLELRMRNHESPRGIGSNPPIIRTSRSGSEIDSGHSKGSQAKLAVAQLKIENLREQQRLKEKRHELDKESLRVELQMGC